MLRFKDRSVDAKLEVSDLKRAEQIWIKDIQKKCFTSEYQILLSGKSVTYNSRLKLCINENQLICCQEHLDNADLPLSWKNPVLLPTKHPYTEFLVKEKHYSVHHDGVQEILAAV